MKKIKRSLFAFLLLFICLILVSCSNNEPSTLLDKVAKKQKIISGVKFDSKPFGFVDPSGNLKGFDVDLMREITKRVLGDENAVEFKQVNAASRIYDLTSGSVDMVAATMTITPKRSDIIDFSNPYYFAGQAFIVSKKSEIDTVKDLKGKKIVVVIGTTSEKNVRILAPSSIVKGYRTYTEAFSALKNGKAEAMISDDAILAGFIYDNNDYKILKERYTKEPYGIGFRKGEDTLTFQRKINMALEEMKADGTMKKLNRKWLSSLK